MHRKIRQIEIGIFVFTLCLGFFHLAQAGEPLEVVRTAVDKAVQVLKDPKLQSQDKNTNLYPPYLRMHQGYPF